MPPTHLLIFDIDGTLMILDEERAFAEAFEAKTGTAPDMDWERYTSNTDWGVAMEILEKHLGRRPSDDEVRDGVDLFVTILRRHIDEGVTPPRLAEGAVDFVRRAAEEGHAVALATGCVRASARAKLEAVGLDDVLVRGGFGDERFDRATLVREAIEAAEAEHGVEFPPDRTCYFGDRTWDCEAARELGIHFVGVAMTQEARQRLTSAGAACIVGGYDELEGPLAVFGNSARS